MGSSTNHLALITLLICLLPHSGSAKHAGYDVVSVAGAGKRLSARLKLVGGTAKFGPDVERLSLAARQVYCMIWTLIYTPC
jgi:hypothetical protein